jgi:hypothetical protein
VKLKKTSQFIFKLSLFISSKKLDITTKHKANRNNWLMNTHSFDSNFQFWEQEYPILANITASAEHNCFLDAINDFKEELKSKTIDIYEINSGIERITWFNDLDEEFMMILNDIISSAKDLKSTLKRQYISLSFVRKDGVAKQETKNFKNAIDELKESYEDLESVLFFLPQMPEFKKTTKKLSLL